MGSLEELLGATQMATSAHSIEEIFTALLLAFLLAQCAAWVYVYTHMGLSYSKAFVQSIILLSIIVSMGMMVIGNNIVVAFGLIGAFAIVRFRNVLKDTRDRLSLPPSFDRYGRNLRCRSTGVHRRFSARFTCSSVAGASGRVKTLQKGEPSQAKPEWAAENGPVRNSSSEAAHSGVFQSRAVSFIRVCASMRASGPPGRCGAARDCRIGNTA